MIYKKLILIILITVSSFAEMEFSDPQPTLEDPRKWVIQLRTAHVDDVNHMLGTVYNVLREYPSGAINIAVVTYGQGVRVLRKDYNEEILSKVLSLMEYEVEFIACKNTMETMKWTEEDFIDDLTYVQAGIAEVIERQAGGWLLVTPY